MRTKPFKKPIIAIEGHPNTWFSGAQMTRDEARELFDYRHDGRLFWRDREGRRSPEAGSEFYRKRLDIGPIWTIQLGSRAAVTRYMRRYLVWNWHFGMTDRVLLPANEDTLDDRIDNIILGGLISEMGEADQAQINRLVLEKRSAAAIDFALDYCGDGDGGPEEGAQFLNAWRDGEWGVIAEEWPDFDLTKAGLTPETIAALKEPRP
ncbi:hypothetical protein [Pleomorphomonas oryzae]|uniref:hypothetical protein n=1 Tax=Pleomorphomonas oryzae TaxID=261934 RepID=UPI000410D201|nr:hypothetical protein [Pleomorphomonas oryzae]